MQSRSLTVVLFSAAGCAVVSAMVGLYWLKQPHPAQEQVERVERFIELLRTANYAEAHTLTMKNALVGQTLPTFEVFAKRQICGRFKMTEVFPLQTNGNRLRRWMSGAEVEMPEVVVQYEGSCLFKVTLRRDPKGNWKVFNFGSHSG